MLAELMQHWGTEGLDAHLKSLQTMYKRRAQLMHDSAKQVSTCLCASDAVYCFGIVIAEGNVFCLS